MLCNSLDRSFNFFLLAILPKKALVLRKVLHKFFKVFNAKRKWKKKWIFFLKRKKQEKLYDFSSFSWFFCFHEAAVFYLSSCTHVRAPQFTLSQKHTEWNKKNLVIAAAHFYNPGPTDKIVEWKQKKRKKTFPCRFSCRLLFLAHLFPPPNLPNFELLDFHLKVFRCLFFLSRLEMWKIFQEGFWKQSWRCENVKLNFHSPSRYTSTGSGPYQQYSQGNCIKSSRKLPATSLLYVHNQQVFPFSSLFPYFSSIGWKLRSEFDWKLHHRGWKALHLRLIAHHQE